MDITPDSKTHGAHMGPIRGRQDPGGPHVGPMNLAIWAISLSCTHNYSQIRIFILHQAFPSLGANPIEVVNISFTFIKGLIQTRPESEAPIPVHAFCWNGVLMSNAATCGDKNGNAINSSPQGQNGRRFADNIFRLTFVNEKFGILRKNSLKFVPKGPIDNNPALVQIMAWRRLGNK